MSDVAEFQALVVRDATPPVAAVETLTTDELPTADVTINVEYAALGFRDCLTISGRGRWVAHARHIPGMEVVGTVLDSNDEHMPVGSKVLAYGLGLGERYWGGFAGQLRVNRHWLMPVPQGFSTYEAAVLGAPAAAAQQAVDALLENYDAASDKPILVTAAGSETGQMCLQLLALAGIDAVAAIAHPDHTEAVQQMGAGDTLLHQTLLERSGALLGTERWSGIIDTAGGPTLSAALSELAAGGTAVVCAPTEGYDLPGSLAPFVVRGCRMIGVNAMDAPMEDRRAVWQKLGRVFSDTAQRQILTERSRRISLDEVTDYSARILQGEVNTRVIVDLNGHED